jgi:hypothetical protein
MCPICGHPRTEHEDRPGWSMCVHVDVAGALCDCDGSTPDDEVADADMFAPPPSTPLSEAVDDLTRVQNARAWGADHFPGAPRKS